MDLVCKYIKEKFKRFLVLSLAFDFLIKLRYCSIFPAKFRYKDNFAFFNCIRMLWYVPKRQATSKESYQMKYYYG